MMVIVKNNKVTADVWAGQTIESSAEYVLQAVDIQVWRDHLKVNADIISGDLRVSDGIAYYTNFVSALDYLKGSLISSKITSLPNAMPFAEPVYRTKRDATASVATCAPNSVVQTLYILTSELWASGGALIIKNAQIGDYITGSVKDVDGVIPAPYRPALCEAWPVVADYILKEWVEIWGEVYTVHRLDTRPLIAKITPGLYLEINYHAANSGTTREIAVNYYMNKKL